MDKATPAKQVEVQACHHMQSHVHALAGDTLKGPMRWVTQLHCSYCKQCGTALRTMTTAQEAAPIPEIKLT